MQLSANSPWQPELDWDSPAGRTLDEIVAALPTGHSWRVVVFGSAPLQVALDRTFVSADVDVIIKEPAEKHLRAAGLLKNQRKLYVEPCPPGTFRAAADWQDRAHIVTRQHVTFTFPHPLDILVSKIMRLEAKDLLAYDLVRRETSFPSEEDLKIALRRVVDFFRPSFDEEKGGDITMNVRALWQHLFQHDIDVRAEIIRPALEERARTYGRDLPPWSDRLRA